MKKTFFPYLLYLVSGGTFCIFTLFIIMGKGGGGGGLSDPNCGGDTFLEEDVEFELFFPFEYTGRTGSCPIPKDGSLLSAKNNVGFTSNVSDDFRYYCKITVTADCGYSRVHYLNDSNIRNSGSSANIPIPQGITAQVKIDFREPCISCDNKCGASSSISRPRYTLTETIRGSSSYEALNLQYASSSCNC